MGSLQTRFTESSAHTQLLFIGTCNECTGAKRVHLAISLLPNYGDISAEM